MMHWQWGSRLIVVGPCCRHYHVLPEERFVHMILILRHSVQDSTYINSLGVFFSVFSHPVPNRRYSTNQGLMSGRLLSRYSKF